MDLKDTIEAVKKWHLYGQILFLENIASLITIAYRDIIEDTEITDTQKLDAIKWINEFQHRLFNTIHCLKNSVEKDEIQAVYKNIQFYAKQNRTTKASLIWALKTAYKRTNEQLTEPTLTAKKQFAILNALNEVCSGAYAIDEEEFHSIIGADKEEVLQFWQEMNNNWVNTYQITQNSDDGCISTTLKKFGQAIEEDEELLFSFQAENYSRAAEVCNRFLGFEPYVPMPDNIIAKRIYSLTDTDNKEIKPVVLTIYQPVKIGEGEWSCSYQISAIQNNALYSIKGVDAIQSIQLAFKIIDGLLKRYNKDKQHQIVWLNTPNDLGLLKN